MKALQNWRHLLVHPMIFPVMEFKFQELENWKKMLKTVLEPEFESLTLKLAGWGLIQSIEFLQFTSNLFKFFW